MRTVVGVFPSMAEAERVARDLQEIGIPRDEISVVAGNQEGRHQAYARKSASTGVAAASGASFGGGVGIIAGLIALAIPGVGPIIAGGALATVLTGLGIGAVGGGLISAFLNMGISHEEAPLYEEAVRRGGVVLATHVTPLMENEAIRVMNEHGARDLQADFDAWRASGWKGPYSLEHPYPSDSTMRSHWRETETLQESEIHAGEIQAADVQPPAQPAQTEAQRPGARSYPYVAPAPVSGSSERAPVSANRRAGEIPEGDPGYAFGKHWACDSDYYGKSWPDVEPTLKNLWDMAGTGSWEQYRDRIRRGYEDGCKLRGEDASAREFGNQPRARGGY